MEDGELSRGLRALLGSMPSKRSAMSEPDPAQMLEKFRKRLGL